MPKTPSPTPAGRLLANAPLVVLFLLAIDSLHFVFAKLLLPYLPPATAGMYVLAVATVEVSIFLLIWDKIRFDLLRRHIWYFLGIGFLVAFSTTLNYTAVEFIDPGTASLLAKTSILFNLAFSLIWLQERLTFVQSLGALVALGGVVTITFQPGDYWRIGSLLILLSAFSYALHAALVKRQSEEIRLAEFFLFRLACTTLFLFLFSLGQQQLVWPGGRAWLLLLLVGTIDITISRGLFYLTLRRLELSFHTIVLMLSPVVAIVWSVFLFDLRPTLQQLLGGLAVLVGVVIVTVSKARLVKAGAVARSPM